MDGWLGEWGDELWKAAQSAQHNRTPVKCGTRRCTKATDKHEGWRNMKLWNGCWMSRDGMGIVGGCLRGWMMMCKVGQSEDSLTGLTDAEMDEGIVCLRRQIVAEHVPSSVPVSTVEIEFQRYFHLTSPCVVCFCIAMLAMNG